MLFIDTVHKLKMTIEKQHTTNLVHLCSCDSFKDVEAQFKVPKVSTSRAYKKGFDKSWKNTHSHTLVAYAQPVAASISTTEAIPGRTPLQATSRVP